MFNKFLFFALFLSSYGAFSQRNSFTHADTLRGSITPERVWWDLSYYHLNVRPNASDSTLTGSTEIRYKVLKTLYLIFLCLFSPNAELKQLLKYGISYILHFSKLLYKLPMLHRLLIYHR